MSPQNALQIRQLGRTGPRVSSPGFGAMGLSGVYGPVDEQDGIDVLHAYLDVPCDAPHLIDTGDFYGSGHNEWLIRRALDGRRREDVVLSVKFGSLRGPDGQWGGSDNRPVAIRNFVTYSLQRLGVDHLDVYRPSRLDPAVPIEDTVGAVAELVQAGHVRHVGLSEVGPETIRRAAAVAPISDLQIEYSLLSRGIETEILPTCRELGIGVTAYGVLSRGLISGSASSGPGDFRAHAPRFQGEAREHNEQLVARLNQLAADKRVTVAQLAIAWVAAQGDDIVPVVGSRRLSQVETLVASSSVDLSTEELAKMDGWFPLGAAQGDRYAAPLMAQLDSER